MPVESVFVDLIEFFYRNSFFTSCDNKSLGFNGIACVNSSIEA
jgi:hypothetical protein